MSILLRGDLHMHSSVSDGRASPKELVLRAIDAGLDIISVTDHDSFRGSLIASRYAKALGLDLVVVIGNEVRSEKGDILILCHEAPAGDPPRRVGELVDWAHANNCLAVPAHPYDLARLGIGDEVYNYPFDAIEVYNASAEPPANRRAAEAARILGLPGIANTDAHVPEYIGTTYTLYLVEDRSPEAVIESIRKGLTRPLPGRPSPRAMFRRYLWSVERRLRQLL